MSERGIDVTSTTLSRALVTATLRRRSPPVWLRTPKLRRNVFEIALKPVADVVYLLRSNDRVLTNNGGLVTVENVPTGRYAILLSQKARLEVVQLQPFAPIPVILGDTKSRLGTGND